MLHRRLGRTGPGRRGVILMVVLAMLTLFALVGITFVLVADNAATASRQARQAESQFRPDIEPEAALALALGQLLYDVNDDDSGIYSALRGHSLARNLYSWNMNATAPLDKPYTGVGRVHQTGVMGFGGQWDDEAYLMNFQSFPRENLRDPEWTAPRNIPVRRWVGGYNVPYTYPDHNNFFLAQINPSTGEVMVPSFHRDYLFGQLDDPNNPNWTNPIGKYLTLRPRRSDQGPRGTNFPMPLDARGDVKNLDGAPGGADSIWIDIGAPVMISGDGRKYKMLVAPLILDLGGRLDLNAVGNILGRNNTHVSNQGWGPWEINPAWLVAQEDNDPGGAAMLADFARLFTGQTAATGMQAPWGRYNQRPTSTTAIPAGPPITGTSSPRAWAQVDYNGCYDAPDFRRQGTRSPNLVLPGASTDAKKYQIEPFFASSAYSNGTNGENTNHPRIYNVYRPQSPNLRFPVAGMAPLLRWGGSGSEMQTSDLMRLADATLNTGNFSPKRRNLVTLLSADLDRIAPTPYIWNPAQGTFQLTGGGVAPAPQAAANIPFPNPPYGTPPANSEFAKDPTNNQALLQSTLAQLGKVNLNRPLTNYPAVNPNTGMFPTDPATQAQVAKATTDRQTFAKDLFDVLRQAVGAADPATVRGIPGRIAEYNALRWLAQVAVNIVDYIDSDSYSTPFNWDAQEYVFGVEMPRLVINEVYVQYDNNRADLARIGGVWKVRPANPATAYTPKNNVNVWVELLDPVPNDPAAGGSDDCNAQLNNGTPGPGQPYQLLLADADINTTVLQNPANTEGDPNFNLNGNPSRVQATMWDWPAWSPTQDKSKVQPMPAGSRFQQQPAGGNVGFYVVGPPDSNYPAGGPGLATANPRLPVTYQSGTNNPTSRMYYQVPADPLPPTPRPTILLRRLANPARPANDTDKGDPLKYNPYITVDFVEFRPGDGGQINDGRLYDTSGPRRPQDIGQMTDRSSWGRPQPYAALASVRRRQPISATPNQPHNTFYRQNSTAATAAALDAANADATLTVPFDWLVHLDRQLISPLELWHVAGCKPHELTQAFTTSFNSGSANKQAVDWVNSRGGIGTANPRNRLYRFLECVETGPAGYGTSAGGRVPGRVNINAVWNGEILRALADPPQTGQPSTSFTQADVDTIAQQLFLSRSPGSQVSNSGTLYRATPSLRPTDYSLAQLAQAARLIPDNKVDKPFWGLGLGPADGNDALSQGPLEYRGRDNTILRNYAPANRPLFDPPSAGAPNSTTHPYLRKQLLNKIFNHLTTRSNVFAVWLTVGYFEVVDDSTQPVKLGAEIGKVENRQIRHRLFAIVDRSQMNLYKGTVSTPSGAPMVAGNQVTARIDITPSTTSLTDSRTGKIWTLQVGTRLTLDEGQVNEETVVVQSVTATTFTFKVQNGHVATRVPFVWRGNPGPWTKAKFDPRQDPDVVPFFSVID